MASFCKFRNRIPKLQINIPELIAKLAKDWSGTGPLFCDSLKIETYNSQLAKRNEKKRFTESQILKVLDEQESGKKVGEICREYGISQPTFYNWKSKYGGMTLSELYRVKELEEENTRLKRIVADQQISIDVLKEVNSKTW